MTGQEAEAKFKGIYEAYHKQVLAYCLRRSRSEGRDLAAETFAIAWRRIDVAPDDEGALPWLYAIARNVLANAHRKQARAVRLFARLSGVAKLSPVEPDTQVVRRWEEQRLVEAVARLRPDDQEILRLVTWEELSHSQIAEMLGISVTAVGQRIHRATDRLRRQFGGSAKTARPDTPVPLAADEGRTA